MAQPQASFRVNTSNYLGISHNNYKNNLLQMALTNTDKYFKLRSIVVKKVKEDAIRQMYETFYNVMTRGTDLAGNPIAPNIQVEDELGANVAVFQPEYPEQKVCEFALGCTRTLEALCEECVQIIMPADYRELAMGRLARKGEANLLGGAPVVPNP